MRRRLAWPDALDCSNPGAVYHMMSRGNRKSAIVEDDLDRRTFMVTIGDAALDCHVRVYSCCLMRTHYHVLLDTPRGNLSAFGRTLNSEYSKAFNHRHARVGHTFKQRFRSIVVQREKYLRRVARYIAPNPVEASLCADAGDWPWSTHRATAGLEPSPSWLYLDWLIWAFRADELQEAQRRYQAYVRDQAGLSWSYDQTTIAVGTTGFRKTIDQLLDASEEGRHVPTQRRWSAQPLLEHVFLDEEPHCRSRDALILLAHRTHGYRVAEIARFLGVVPSTVSKALRRARIRMGD